jgi:hypothetical protein
LNTNSEFFKDKKKASDVLYDQALDALDAINPDLKDEFEKDIESFKKGLKDK